MMSLIGDYLGQLFGFINNQELGFNMSQAERKEQIDTLENEIFTLRDQLNKRDDELKEAKLQLVEYENQSAEELVKGILNGRDNENDAGSDPDSEGTAQSSDGNYTTAESPDLTADSLFQLHLGIAHSNNP
jgi:ribosomal protein L29